MDSITILSDHPLVLSIVPYTCRAISVLIRAHICDCSTVNKFQVLLVLYPRSRCSQLNPACITACRYTIEVHNRARQHGLQRRPGSLSA